MWDSPNLRGPGSRTHIPQEQDGPVIPAGTGIPIRRLLRLTRLHSGNNYQRSLSRSCFTGVHYQILHFPSFCRKTALLFVFARPLWREHGSIICRALCQWSESRRTHNHTLMSHLRPRGSLSVVSYDSQGLRWKYSYPPPHGEQPTTNEVEVEV
jgi:hypothetical protein